MPTSMAQQHAGGRGGRAGYLLQLRAVDTFCFIHHGADGAQNSKTCREDGGIAVNPGIDIATHLNIVPSFP